MPTPSRFPSSVSVSPPLALDERAAASRLGVSVYLLRRWRGAGTGPAVARLGRRVLYPIEQLDEFFRAHVAARPGE